jgi:hypothetical protein
LTINVWNPLQTSFSIQNVLAQVFWKGNFFGAIRSNAPIDVPVGATVTSPTLILQAPTDFQFGLFMVTTFLPANLGVLTGANVDVDMQSTIDVTVGGPVGVGNVAKLSYNQTALPAFLKLDWGFGGVLKKRAEEYSTTLVREEPSVESGMEYVQWLREALFAAYPEEAKLYVEGLNK